MNEDSYRLAAARDWAMIRAQQYHKRKREGSLDDIIESAKKISSFYEGKQSATVSLVSCNRKPD